MSECFSRPSTSNFLRKEMLTVSKSNSSGDSSHTTFGRFLYSVGFMKPLNSGMHTFKLVMRTNMKKGQSYTSHKQQESLPTCELKLKILVTGSKRIKNQPRSIIQCLDTRYPQLNLTLFQMFLTGGLDVVMCDGFPVIDKVFLQGQRRGELQRETKPRGHHCMLFVCLFISVDAGYTTSSWLTLFKRMARWSELKYIIKVAEVPLDDDLKQRVHTWSGNIR